MHHFGCVTGVWEELEAEQALPSQNAHARDERATHSVQQNAVEQAQDLLNTLSQMENPPRHFSHAVDELRSMLRSEADAHRPRSLTITGMVEKPSEETAQKTLRVPGMDLFLTVFGLYVLESSIFTHLNTEINANARDEKGVIGLTPALNKLRAELHMMGYVVEGHRHDLGQPDHLMNSLIELQLGAGQAPSSARR